MVKLKTKFEIKRGKIDRDLHIVRNEIERKAKETSEH